MPEVVVFGIRPSFLGLSRCDGQIAHVLLTRSPLEYPRRGLSARLACVKHAASVRPEPGSNSPTKTWKIIPATKNAAKGIPPDIKPGRGKSTWHWLIKHPVEFSKNNHTPFGIHLVRGDPLGATALTYLVDFASARPESWKIPGDLRGIAQVCSR